MRARAGSTDQLFVDWGSTGSTLGVRVDDLEGNVAIARQTGFVEFPASSGLYYLDPFTFPEDAGSYVLVYDDDGGSYAIGHTATEDLTVSSAVGGDSDTTVRAGAVDQLFVDWGATGATIGVRVDDLTGSVAIARQTGFTESPAGSGLYYLDPFTYPDEAGSYVLVFDDDGGTYALGHTATRGLTVTSGSYSDTDELFRVLKIREPSAAQLLAGERVLATATYEIDHFVAAPDDDPLAGAELELVRIVCIERAVEHWRQQEISFGLMANDALGGPAERIARDTFERHRWTLSSLKRRWGFA